MLLNEIFVNEDESLKDTLKRLNIAATKVLLVADGENRLLGTISDGDIRRAMLNGKSLDSGIKEIYNKKPICLDRNNFNKEAAKHIFLQHKIELIPIIDEGNRITGFITWSEVFSNGEFAAAAVKPIDIPLVIMAGGKGSRLEPFTKILPKALIPIGDTPIIEIIISEFRKYGIVNYYLTLNHKSDMIELYFNNSPDRDYNIKFKKEDSFLGTAGGLKALENEINGTFAVSNCDVIVKADFNEVINFHRSQKAVLTILSSIKNYKIPYGIIDFKEKGEVVNVTEKPEHIFAINTGVYILEKEALGFIPDNSYFDMTDLIKALIKNKKKVITYPVSETNYIDIGHWDEYKKSVDYFNKAGLI